MLAPDLLAVRVRSNRYSLKYPPARTHLMVTPEQWLVLQCFTTTRRVPDVLCELIANRQSLPLAEYYELILKTVQVGLLQTAGIAPPPPVPSSPWHRRFQATPVLFLSLMALGFGSAFTLLRPLTLPAHWLDLVLGFALVCAATSAGCFIAASTLRGAGGEVYNPGWKLRSLFPHFTVDLDDVVMLPRADEINVALARLAPHFATAFATSLYLPGAVFPVLFGAMVQISPAGNSPMMALLRALYRDPLLDTARDFAFAQDQSLLVLLRARLKFADTRFLLMCAGYSVVWLLLIFLAVSAFMKADAWELFQRFRETGPLEFTAVTLLVLMAGLVVGTLGLGLWIIVAPVFKWVKSVRRLGVASRMEPPPLNAESLRELLANHVLFRDLPTSELKELAACMKSENRKKGDVVVRQGEQGDTLYLIYSGSVEILREDPGSASVHVAELVSGDVFGEIALLRGGVRTRTVRCTGASVLLALGKREFDGLVLNRISREAVETVIQKVTFLKRIPLSNQWSQAAVAAFSGRATFRSFQAGDKLVVHGDTNQFFHVVYEGELGVEKGGKEIVRLKSGDFFGEISLLQSSTATAAVIARTPGRCLILVRRDFLEFISRDFLIGLQFEKISSSRMGRPIFPLAQATFTGPQR